MEMRGHQQEAAGQILRGGSNGGGGGDTWAGLEDSWPTLGADSRLRDPLMGTEGKICLGTFPLLLRMSVFERSGWLHSGFTFANLSPLPFGL